MHSSGADVAPHPCVRHDPHSCRSDTAGSTRDALNTGIAGAAGTINASTSA